MNENTRTWILTGTIVLLTLGLLFSYGQIMDAERRYENLYKRYEERDTSSHFRDLERDANVDCQIVGWDGGLVKSDGEVFCEKSEWSSEARQYVVTVESLEKIRGQ